MPNAKEDFVSFNQRINVQINNLPEIQLLSVPFGTYSKTRKILLTLESSK